jgi:RNA polymerase sigma factor (sigma-70 family)
MTTANSDNKDRTAELVSELIRTHGPRLQRLITKIVRDADAAQHILQETYLHLYTRLRDVSATPVVNAKAYLFNAAFTNAFEQLRAQKRRERAGLGAVTDEATATSIPDRSPGPQKSALVQEAMQQLSDLVDALPRNQRRVFVLGKVHGLARRDIAADLGISEVAVDKAMTRALATLRIRLAELGIESVLALEDPLGQ